MSVLNKLPRILKLFIIHTNCHEYSIAMASPRHRHLRTYQRCRQDGNLIKQSPLELDIPTMPTRWVRLGWVVAYSSTAFSATAGSPFVSMIWARRVVYGKKSLLAAMAAACMVRIWGTRNKEQETRNKEEGGRRKEEEGRQIRRKKVEDVRR